MIQKANPATPVEPSSRDEQGLDSWSQWWGHKQYSLEIVQHPIRARMCGFGDKDRRPLAPAAVAKMVVRRDDTSLVDVDELDCSFFLVTVDLWSADGRREMNLVLHPSSSADRYIPTTIAKPKRHRGANQSASSPHSDHPSPPSSHSTPNSATESSRPPMDSQPVMNSMIPGQTHPGYSSSSYSYPPPGPPLPEGMAYAGSSTYNSSPDSPEGWGYPSTGTHGSQNFHNSSLRNAPRGGMAAAASGESWNAHPTHAPVYRTDADTTSYRTWPVSESSYQAPVHPHPGVYGTDMDPSSRSYHPTAQSDTREFHQWNQSPQEPYTTPAVQGSYEGSIPYGTSTYPQQSSHIPYYQNNYAQSSASSSPPPPPPASIHPLPRHTYTRTLVGPLSSNACRLLDEHRKPGIFFLFQDLSVRTEGTFRLRLRLMNIGDAPAPEAGALRVHTHVSPVLAQTFTHPFVVYSAKRFPGVPDTTALSIAFGNQGQKLPLRNRHGAGRQGRKTQRDGDSDGSESSDDT
ncbi:velvet factor [Melanogaster broomeanus]|nr:velvet factor [Melanogaster broomeanus]